MKKKNKTDLQIKQLNKLTKSILEDLDKKGLAELTVRMKNEEPNTFLWVLLAHTLMKKME